MERFKFMKENKTKLRENVPEKYAHLFAHVTATTTKIRSSSLPTTGEFARMATGFVLIT